MKLLIMGFSLTIIKIFKYLKTRLKKNRIKNLMYHNAKEELNKSLRHHIGCNSGENSFTEK